MRGDKLSMMVALGIWSRITPACAGIRSFETPGYWKSQDHPRMRGDKTLKFLSLK